jgi:O-antigen/teichoic acid export membrane protein
MSRAPMAVVRDLIRQGLADRAARYSLFNTARSVVTGPVTAYLVATSFSKDVQGYYYTFASLMALQVFAELGLGTVITQFASHEWAGLSLQQGRIQGASANVSRLAGLLHFSVRWYSIVAAVVLLPLAGFGAYFLSTSPGAGLRWQGPWFTLCLLASLRLMLTPAFSLLDGCAQVISTTGFRLLEGLVMVAVTWTSVLLGYGLWTPSVSTFGSLLVAAIFLGVGYRGFFGQLFRLKVYEKIAWREEILPMQWRIALSWLAGYFVFQLFTPILFRYRGPQEAGRFGLTWNIVSSISAIGAAFVQTRATTFGSLVATRDFAELDRRCRNAAALALLGTAGAAIALLALLHELNVFYPAIAARCLEIGPTAVLLTATVLMQISTVQAVYLRAFKREPFLGLSLVCGAVTGLSTWYFGWKYGATGMAWGYLAIVVLLVLPWGTGIFVARRRLWAALPA